MSVEETDLMQLFDQWQKLEAWLYTLILVNPPKMPVPKSDPLLQK